MGFLEIYAAVKEWDSGSFTSKLFLAIGLWLMIKNELRKQKTSDKKDLELIKLDIKEIKAHVGLDKKENHNGSSRSIGSSESTST